jgi:transposase
MSRSKPLPACDGLQCPRGLAAITAMEPVLGRPALEANHAIPRKENARLREESARRDVELGRVNAELPVLKRLVFGRSSERARPEAAGRDGDGSRDRVGNGNDRRRGPGRGRGGGITRIYPGSRRSGISWRRVLLPGVRGPVHAAGDHVLEQLNWQVVVRVAAHCGRRYRRVCRYLVPAKVRAPGLPKAVGKGLCLTPSSLTAADGAVRGRAQSELPGRRSGAARWGPLAANADRDLRGRRGAVGPVGGRDHRPVADSWHLHADETSWHVYVPARGQIPGSLSLWVFLGPDTACFVMDPPGLGQCWPARRDRRVKRAAGPRLLVISLEIKQLG